METSHSSAHIQNMMHHIHKTTNMMQIIKDMMQTIVQGRKPVVSVVHTNQKERKTIKGGMQTTVENLMQCT